MKCKRKVGKKNKRNEITHKIDPINGKRIKKKKKHYMKEKL